MQIKTVSFVAKLIPDTRRRHMHTRMGGEIVSREPEQTPLFTHNYAEALEFADNDIKTNWELYRERFLKEVGND